MFLQEKCDNNESWVGNVGIIDNVPTYNHILDLKEEMDFENRRPKNPWWQNLTKVMTFLLKREGGLKSRGIKNNLFTSRYNLNKSLLLSKKSSYIELEVPDMIPLENNIEIIDQNVRETNVKETNEEKEEKNEELKIEE